MAEMLSIVDEDDNVIGERSREEIHREGLLHREIHVYFVTPDKRVILQHRAKDKDTFPDLLDATVGGHVEIGDTYLETAIKETEEETGVKLSPSDLILINKNRRKGVDVATGKINQVFGESYLYIFRGDIKALHVEQGKAIGFEAVSLEDLEQTDVDESRMIPYVLQFCRTTLLNFLNNQ